MHPRAPAKDGQVTTVGIDLASQPEKTAVCVINWGNGSAEVTALSRGTFHGRALDDLALLEIADTADKTAIDAPFGWPQPFIQAISSEPGRWPLDPGQPRAPLERRTTDILVRQWTGKTPLSVTTDRIAYCAMRCAAILGALNSPRDGSGPIVEAYPDAALRCWLPNLFVGSIQSYKGDSDLAYKRRELLGDALFQELGSSFHISEAQRGAIANSDDCLDALACALVARAAATKSTVLPDTPEHETLARIEGWIHLPEPNSLQRLVTAQPDAGDP
jgi:hypothetical protein